jgi:hypothetical protein
VYYPARVNATARRFRSVRGGARADYVRTVKEVATRL